MKIPQTTLSEIHSKEPFHRLGELEVKGHFTHKIKGTNHCIMRSLIGRKGWKCPSSLHTRRWRHEDYYYYYFIMDEKVYMDSYMMIDDVCRICVSPHPRGRHDAYSSIPCRILQKNKNSYPISHGVAFGWESRIVIVTRWRPLAYIWSGPKEGLWPYYWHFQLYKQILAVGSIWECIIRLAFVNHAYWRCKF